MKFTSDKSTLVIAIALAGVFASSFSVQSMENATSQTAPQPANQRIVEQYGNGVLPELTTNQIEEFYDQGFWSREQRDIIKNDPYYNPNLTNISEDFSLSNPPRHEYPWRKIESFPKIAKDR